MKMHISKLFTLLPLIVRADNTKKINGWAIWQQADETAKQMLDPSWARIYDTVQLKCGMNFDEDGLIRVNETELVLCQPIFDAAEQTGVKVSSEEIDED